MVQIPKWLNFEIVNFLKLNFKNVQIWKYLKFEKCWYSEFIQIKKLLK
jgi:hypothetical protein